MDGGNHQPEAHETYSNKVTLLLFNGKHEYDYNSICSCKKSLLSDDAGILPLGLLAKGPMTYM